MPSKLWAPNAIAPLIEVYDTRIALDRSIASAKAATARGVSPEEGRLLLWRLRRRARRHVVRLRRGAEVDVLQEVDVRLFPEEL